MGYYSVVSRNRIFPFGMTWIRLSTETVGDNFNFNGINSEGGG